VVGRRPARTADELGEGEKNGRSALFVMMAKKRDYGTGGLYIDPERGAYYGRWRTADGRQLNRKVGPVRSRGETDGLTQGAGREEVPQDAGGRGSQASSC
jgi:hypothetical protein